MPETTSPTLTEIIASVESHRKTLRVCNYTGEDVELARLEEFFEPHDIEVVVENDHPERAEDTVVLTSHGTELASNPMDELRRYIRAWDVSMAAGLDTEPPAVLRRLHDNHFESYDKRRMVMASRIAEFRAWNVGAGTLHAGFQQLSKINNQRNVYRNLADTAVEVHVYGEPDDDWAEELGVNVHASTADEVLDHWWVAYDGAGRDDNKVVLLAQEREPDRFYGFWTYEPAVVADVLTRMTEFR